MNSKKVETEDLNEQANKTENFEDAATIIKEYEEIIRTIKKNIVSIAYHHENVFRKFKEKEKFIKLFKELKVHKTTMIFKITIVELIDEYPKLMKSSVTLIFLKTYFKDKYTVKS